MQGLLKAASWCDVEDVLWVKLSNVASGVDMVLAVCYIPPISSGREVCLEERWQCLSEQVSKYASLSTVLLCGDFNARCGCVEEVEGLGDRQSEDQVINEQGRALLDFTRSLGLCVANGRAGSGDFTCISSKGCSVVDYCLLFKDDLGVVSNFKVVTMTEFVDAFHADCIVERIPDHSALVWDLVLDGDVGCSGGEPEDTPGECFGNEFRYVVPDDYLCDKKRDIESIVDNLRSYEGDQAHMDSLYDQLTGLMFSGLHKVKCSLRTSRQKHRWFTKDLMNMRKTFHQSERAWLRTKDKEERKCKRMHYVANRRTYAKAVRSSKRNFIRSQQLQLEKLLCNPKRWWRKVKKMGIVNRKVSDGYLGKVLDNSGVTQSGEEAVKVWSAHFREVLQGSKEPPAGESGLSVCREAPQGEHGSDNPELEGEITQEEVMWAFSKVKKRKSPGKRWYFCRDDGSEDFEGCVGAFV